jgi:YVTN family beta-propeller protein
MTEPRWRFYARALAALALMAMPLDPAWAPGGLSRAQASSPAPQAARQGAAAATGQARPSLLVLNKAENTLAVVDPSTMQVVARIPTGEGPHEVVVSSDSRRAFVASMATGRVTAVDLETLTVAGSVQTGKAPDGLAWVG